MLRDRNRAVQPEDAPAVELRQRADQAERAEHRAPVAGAGPPQGRDEEHQPGVLLGQPDENLVSPC